MMTQLFTAATLNYSLSRHSNYMHVCMHSCTYVDNDKRDDMAINILMLIVILICGRHISLCMVYLGMEYWEAIFISDPVSPEESKQSLRSILP